MIHLAFRLYRALVALGLGAVAFTLASLALTRPVEMAEGSALLLVVAVAAVILAILALFRHWGAGVTLLATAVAAALVLGLGEPRVATVIVSVAVIEAAALAWLRPWRPLARDRQRD